MRVRIPALLLFLIICLYPVKVMGAGSVQAEVPVRIILTYPYAEDEYVLQLRALDGTPEPDGNTITLYEAGEAYFPAITYTSPAFTATRSPG